MKPSDLRRARKLARPTRWLDNHPVAQRRRESRRRNKADSQRDYRVRRAMGRTPDHMMSSTFSLSRRPKKPVPQPWHTERINGEQECARRRRQIERGVLT